MNGLRHSAAAIVLGLATAAPGAWAGSTNANFNVNIDVLSTQGCDLFGSGSTTLVYDASSPADTDVYSNMQLRCTPGTAWTVSFDQGQHADAGSTCITPLRRVSNGSQTLGYSMFKDGARTQVFGCDTGNGISDVGTGDFQFPFVFLRFPAGQPVAVQDVFTDVVVATLTF
jgi:spore coat protein U-like protein